MEYLFVIVKYMTAGRKGIERVKRISKNLWLISLIVLEEYFQIQKNIYVYISIYAKNTYYAKLM